MTTVEQVTAPYDNVLTPILPPGEGVCAVCKSVVSSDYERCYQCNNHAYVLPKRARVVVPVALSTKGGQWAHELSAYKNSSGVRARRTMTIKLGAVLWRWLDSHEECLMEAAEVDGFPVVTSVPSTSGRPDHPLPGMLRDIVGPISGRYSELLVANPKYPTGSREASRDRFTVQGKSLRGDPVLLIDDQWTTGGRAQSAAAALRLSGSGPVAIVPLGRHFDPRPSGETYREAAQRYLRAARTQGWDWDRCCLCG